MTEPFGREILVNAIDENGRRWHISEVAKGDGRVYRCPSSLCGHQVLVPKKGDIRRHHFAHKGGNCAWAVEAGVADLVCEIIQTEGILHFPSLSYYDSDKRETSLIAGSRALRVVGLRREGVSGRPVEEIVVTCRAAASERNFSVLIWLSHAPTSEQIKAVEESGRDCVGIDLRALYRSMKEESGRHLDAEAAYAEIQTRETLKEVVLGDDPCKRWVFNRKGSELAAKSKVLKKEREAREAEERNRRLADRRAQEERLRRESDEKAAAKAAEAEPKEITAGSPVAKVAPDRSGAAPLAPLRKRELGAFRNCWVWKCPGCGTDDQTVMKGAKTARCRICGQPVAFG